jgi:hypothetical protein
MLNFCYRSSKKKMQTFSLVFGLALIFSGCAMNTEVVRLSDASETRAATTDVKLYSARESVPVKFRELAVITVDDNGWDRSDNELVEEAKAEARQMGADAIVLTGSDSVPTGGIVTNGVYTAGTKKILRALAIEFTTQ